VPEAAVDEDGDSRGGEHEVRLPRPSVARWPKTLPPQGPSEAPLGARALGTDTAHQLAALSLRHDVDHGLPPTVGSYVRLTPHRADVPAKIDRIGRAHEWLTRAILLGSEASLAEAKRFLDLLPEPDRKRVTAGAKRTAEHLRALHPGRRVIAARAVGEDSKKPGEGDADLLLTFEDGGAVGYSLKIQASSEGVNVRNPTANSLTKALAGREFSALLTASQQDWYRLRGEEYAKGELDSKVVGQWGVKVLANAFREAHHLDPPKFVGALLRELRVGTNLILTVVDQGGRFLGHSTKYSRVAGDVRAEPKRLAIDARGISVRFALDGVELCHVDVYMMSGSEGKGTKLRAAIRCDFELDRP